MIKIAKECSKAAIRRFNNGHFHNRYFVGNGIDIGAGDDSLVQWLHVFKGIKFVKTWDLPEGDAQFMNGIENETYDFVTANHCLEHLNDPIEGMLNWLRITKPGGFVIVLVPDFSMYEREIFPSVYNNQHKSAFTLKYFNKNRIYNVLEFCLNFKNIATIESINLQHQFYNPIDEYDQTKYRTTECAIEFIMRKNTDVKDFIQPNIPGITTEKNENVMNWFPNPY